MEHPEFDKYDTTSLKSIGGGGAPTPASQVKKTAKKFKGGSPGQGYGLTETNGGICFNNGEEYIKRPTSCGRPYPIVDVLVVKLVDGEDPKDEVGDVCLTEVSGANQVGELVIKSPLVMSHYFNKLNKTATCQGIYLFPSRFFFSNTFQTHAQVKERIRMVPFRRYRRDSTRRIISISWIVRKI